MDVRVHLLLLCDTLHTSKPTDAWSIDVDHKHRSILSPRLHFASVVLRKPSPFWILCTSLSSLRDKTGEAAFFLCKQSVEISKK